MSKAEKIAGFDPNSAGAADGGLFGLPFTPEEAEIVVVPVPWEVTVSYSAGTAAGPAAILEASKQVDLYDQDYPEAWKLGIAMLPIPEHLQEMSEKYRQKAVKLIDFQISGGDFAEHGKKKKQLEEVNAACEAMNTWVREQVAAQLKAGKLVALLGGDHSTPLGAFQAMAVQYPSFGILHLDAHADLRDAFEHFTYSHASIMFNALQIPQISKLVQVGIRDFCEQEAGIMQDKNGRVRAFTNREIERARFEGRTWKEQCAAIVAELPELVYLSFDIDGLDPTLCPHTGTPVAGGMRFEEACYLVESVVAAGKKIIGLDLVEVAPGEDEWDANVGSRMLFRICNLMARSQGKL